MTKLYKVTASVDAEIEASSEEEARILFWVNWRMYSPKVAITKVEGLTQPEEDEWDRHARHMKGIKNAVIDIYKGEE